MAVKKTDGRRLRAQATRSRMLDAAMKLFVEHGYAQTTIEAIAKDAGVAGQTIYFSFGNKQQILKELIDLHVAGDDQPVPTLERAPVVEALAESDPEVMIGRLVEATREVHARVAPLLEVLRNAAASTGAGGEELWEANKRQRREVQRHFVDALSDLAPRPAGLTQERAVDVCYALLGPEVYHLLVGERGWTPEQWESWARDGLRLHLLGMV